MHHFKIFSLVLLLFYTAATAQTATIGTDSLKKQTFIKINIASIADPRTPTLQLGAERRLNARWAGELIIGLPFYASDPYKKEDSLYHSYFKIKPQIKYYIPHSTAYIAAELFSTFIKYNQFHNQYVKHNVTYGYTKADFKKSVTGLAIKFGGMVNLWGNWFLEPASGWGIRWVYTSVYAPDAQPSQYWQRWGGPEKIGHKFTPHIASELKFGYWIQ